MPRPRSDASRREAVNLRATTEELERWKRAAGGKTLSEFLRDAATTACEFAEWRPTSTGRPPRPRRSRP